MQMEEAKKAGVAVLDKPNFKTKTATIYKERHYIVLRESIQQKDNKCK